MQKPHSGMLLSHAFFCLKDALKNEKELSDQSLVCSSACTQVPPGHSCGSSGQTQSEARALLLLSLTP